MKIYIREIPLRRGPPRYDVAFSDEVVTTPSKEDAEDLAFGIVALYGKHTNDPAPTVHDNDGKKLER